MCSGPVSVRPLAKLTLFISIERSKDTCTVPSGHRRCRPVVAVTPDNSNRIHYDQETVHNIAPHAGTRFDSGSDRPGASPPSRREQSRQSTSRLVPYHESPRFVGDLTRVPAFPPPRATSAVRRPGSFDSGELPLRFPSSGNTQPTRARAPLAERGGVILTLNLLLPGRGAGLTEARAHRLSVGMTRAQVVSILGPPHFETEARLRPRQRLRALRATCRTSLRGFT